MLAIAAAAYWGAWLLRFDFAVPTAEKRLFYSGLGIVLVAKFAVWTARGLQRERWWGYESFSDAVRLLQTNLLASLVSFVLLRTVFGSRFSRSIYCLDLLVCFSLTAGIHFAGRMHGEFILGMAKRRREKGILIYGAGVAAIDLAREIRYNPKLGYKVLGFIDDDPRKRGATITGLRVFGSGDDIPQVVARLAEDGARVDEIVVSMPSATGVQNRSALAKAKAGGVPSRVVPGLGELISGKLSLKNAREISVTDLLGRDSVELDLAAVQNATAGRCVLVTGAAGSIGSELCHQLAAVEPRMLVALDQAESELFRLEADLRAKYPDLNLAVEVGDIRDPAYVEDLIDRYAVNSIYHAAAYKHVPLMERQVCEAARNNVIGTWNLARAAWRSQVSNFLLISTDKAVNPTSIMGLTKRVAELIVTARRSAAPGESQTKFVCVRFGNVLVSNGSVVPTFQKQIAAGGPVTVTHPDMRRYFMTVREAVQLVLQASAMSNGNEIYVLDMGRPVKIVDLARKMITLAGFTPGDDIEIRFTGLRPGEKLFEEVSLVTEAMKATSHPDIRIFQGPQLDVAALLPWLEGLERLLARRDGRGVLRTLSLLVPEYQGDAGKPDPDATRSTAAGAASEAAGDVLRTMAG